MGLFNRNQPKNSSDKKGDASPKDDVISDLLSEPLVPESKGITLGYDEELDAGLANFKKAQANPSEEEQFAKAMAHQDASGRHMASTGFEELGFDAADATHYDAFASDTYSSPGDAHTDHFLQSDSAHLGGGYQDTPSYFIEDHRTPYTESAPLGKQAQRDLTNTANTANTQPEQAASNHRTAFRKQKAQHNKHQQTKTHQHKVQHNTVTNTSPETVTQQPSSSTTPPAAPRYGIADAIKLLRQLPETGDVAVLMTIVKRTLETTGIRISDIIDDSEKHRHGIQKRVGRLQVEIEKLEKQMLVRTTEINNLTAQLTETEQVQELLELAEMPAPARTEHDTLHPAVPSNNASEDLESTHSLTSQSTAEETVTVPDTATSETLAETSQMDNA